METTNSSDSQDYNKFNMGGFPPIYEVLTTIKKKEFNPSSILSIQSILSKRNMNRDIPQKNTVTVNRITK
jgi:hypothetical protein